ncbi:MAG TPA: GTP-binding protein, partial [Candidatus Dorea intestinavium]|nr:GTP-binding protein [Candidatus Dorea intestinavium]
MNALTIGVLAHVDAGKTTLTEALLYKSGAIKKKGRVDHQDAFLDTHDLEQKRGITILAKTATYHYKDKTITLLDTPGHVDFSPEAERAIIAMDYAVLVISAT